LFSKQNNIVLFVGGVGGAKLAYGLYHTVPHDHLTIIVNTGDDFWHYGLRICPDMDTVMYTLADLVDRDNGWGVADDTRQMLGMLQQYGESPWFGLGDKDLATHLLRSQALHAGKSLTEISGHLTASLQIGCTILPMTDTFVSTMVDTVEYGEIGFQEYFVKYRWQPTVKALRFSNIDQSTITPAVRSAIETADTIIIGPSNPWLSIDPIMHIPGMQTLIQGRHIPRLAVTPIVAGDALKGPAAKLMQEWGYAITASRVAKHYTSIINGFVYDIADADFDRTDLPENLRIKALDTVMNTDEKRLTLASQLLTWTEELTQ